MKWQEIAVIGMQVRVPGAQNPWDYLAQIEKGKVVLSSFDHPKGWVGVGGVLKDADCFDAEFFMVSEREAYVMDPQHRLLLECVWQALEIAGYRPNATGVLTGLIASCSANIYHWMNLESQLSEDDMLAKYQNLLGNDKDFLATRIAHKLNLKGPCYTIQSGCSSSALACHQACRLLQLKECDLTIAAGVALTLPLRKGYPIVEGMIYSSKGVCRPYSQEADGTIDGTGCGVLVLKRLEDALRDGNEIWAVIKGSAVNNDGSAKMHFTAPSVDQQITVMKAALDQAGLAADAIEFVEGHGTGTILGDAIELVALQEVYGCPGENSCRIGSVKANLGHLDVASGIIGLAKAILCVKFAFLPPQPAVFPVNEQALSSKSRLCFSEQRTKWKSEKRRAAVSSLGIGGTNVHMIVESFQQIQKNKPSFKIFKKTRFPSPAEKEPKGKEGNQKKIIDPSRALDEAWQHILGDFTIPDPNDHFFLMGGNSLNSIELVAELNKRLDLTLSPVILYEFPTRKGILEYLVAQINQKKEINDIKEEIVNIVYEPL